LTPTAQGSYLNNCSFFKLEITVRDIAGNPIPRVDVDIEWEYGHVSISIHTRTINLAWVRFIRTRSFGWRTLRSYTDAFGVARFQVREGLL
jgi:hypothetical protein